MNDTTILTVFTPTYNRKSTIQRTYLSLRSQTNKNFIWLIVDDGSSDDTETEVRTWIDQEKSFEIRYVYKENGGLHTAYNTAIEIIDTELCVCIDSDDWMPSNAVERILTFWKENGNEQYAGIVGLDCFEDGTVVGDCLPKQKSVNLIDLLVGRYKLKNGDRTNVVRTELYKRYAPMKVLEGEKNFNPHYLHLQISKEYDFLVLNENLRFVEYQASGMSNSILKQYRNSPNSFAETRLLYLNFDNTSFAFKFRHSVHLVSSCILAHKFNYCVRESPCKLITLLAIPTGVALSIYIQIKT